MIIFFDTETTGVFHPRDQHWSQDWKVFPRIVQLAYIVAQDDGRVMYTGNHIIRPNGWVIPKEASDVHGISTEAAIEQGVDIKYVLKHFIMEASKADIVVGHNLFFDISIVKSEILRLGIPIEPINKALDKEKRVDTMTLSTDYCKIPSPYSGFKWPKLEELYKILFNEEMINAHDALIDIQYTMKCYFKLKELNII